MKMETQLFKQSAQTVRHVCSACVDVILSCYQFKEDGIDRTCSTHGKRGPHIGVWWESRKERIHYEDLGEIGSLILK
jgi:hypothetical protein